MKKVFNAVINIFLDFNNLIESGISFKVQAPILFMEFNPYCLVLAISCIPCIRRICEKSMELRMIGAI